MSVPSISIIGAGNIGSAVAGLAVKAGASTQVLVRDASKATGLSGVDVAQIGSPLTGDIVVLALPYAAIDGAGHNVHLDQPAVTAALLDTWLTALATGFAPSTTPPTDVEFS